ncbi:MAG: hypothetical protein Q9186_005941, partial [Xanthomendoza sp. 1 TL-2023]
MRLSTVLAIVTAVGASTASAKCFNTGQNWVDHDDAKSKLNDACNSIQGNFGPGEIRNECRDAPDFRSYKFEVQNENKDNSVIVSHDACVKNIEREIDNCGHGGEETFGGIRF